MPGSDKIKLPDDFEQTLADLLAVEPPPKDEDKAKQDGPAVEAELFGPSDIAVTPNGTLYIAAAHERRLRRVSPDGTQRRQKHRRSGGDCGNQMCRPVPVAIARDLEKENGHHELLEQPESIDEGFVGAIGIEYRFVAAALPVTATSLPSY